MNALLNNRFARWAALAAAAVIGWFVTKDIVSPQDAAKATEDLTTLFQGVGAAVLMVLTFLAGLVVKKFTGRDSGGSGGTGSSGGTFPCLLITAAAFAMAGALPSCSPAAWSDIAGAWDAKAVIHGTDKNGNGIDIVIRPKAKVVEEKRARPGPEMNRLLEHWRRPLGPRLPQRMALDSLWDDRLEQETEHVTR